MWEMRLTLSRSQKKNTVAYCSTALVEMVAAGKVSVEEALTIMTPAVDYVISDCDIYHGMDAKMARDAIKELSNLAALYVHQNDAIYNRINGLIQNLLRSYPPPDTEIEYSHPLADRD